VDLSAFIFAGLAVAWAVYLVPKLLKHHDDVVRSRSAERPSRSTRVLARREAVDARNSRLVVTPARGASESGAASEPVPTSGAVAETGSVAEIEDRAAERTTGSRPAADAPRTAATPTAAVRRAAARRAVRRRRRVLGLVLLANAVVGGLAIARVIDWPWALVPAGLLVAWLVACRLMVKGERVARASAVRPRAAAVPDDADEPTGAIPVVDTDAAPEVVVDSPLTEAPAASTGEFSAVGEPVEGLWDPVPTTLPTYVSKPAAARRTVQTIDLDSTGVWSSGRNEIDSALAREAEAAEKVEKVAEAVRSERRVSGA
jgi:hypothetical protein